jgi:crotonobetaine/carnitine-CoA ligase
MTHMPIPVPLEADNTIPRMLIRQAERLGDKPLIRFPGEGVDLGYARLAAHALAGSARLEREHGVQPGAVAALYLGNCGDYVKAWFSCLFAGVIDVPVNHEFRKALLLYALSSVGTEVVITDAEGAAHLLDPEVRGYLGQLRLLVLCGSFDRERLREQAPDVQLPTVVMLDELTTPGPRGTVWETIDGAMPALIRFTSGTTGAPKGILQSHLHALGKSMVINRLLEMGEQDILYSPFPLHHNLASVNGLIGMLQLGGTMVSAPRFSASGYWQDARACRATRGHLLQAVAPLVMAQPPSPLDRQHSMRLLWTGGPDRAFEERFGVEWIQSFSIGEVGCVASRRGAEPGSTAVGVPLPEFEIAIVDTLDRPLPTGARGELVIRPRHPHRVMLAYHNNLPATMRAFRNLWFHTGDAALIAADGQLHWLGRIGDTIRRRGVNISAEQLDAEVRQHPAVLDCGVIAIDMGNRHQEIHACVLWREPPADAASAYAELAQFLAGRLAREYVPRFFESVADLPRTGTGKVRKVELRDRAQYGPTWDRQAAAWLAQPGSKFIPQETSP